MLAFSRSRHWGNKRKGLLREQIEKTLVIPISHPGVHERWAEVSSALRAAGNTIGQNDIWIAATASVAGTTLLTTGGDFERMRGLTSLDVRVLDDRTGLALI